MMSCGAGWHYQSVAESAPVSNQNVMKWMRPVVQDDLNPNRILLSDTTVQSSSNPTLLLILWVSLFV